VAAACQPPERPFQPEGKIPPAAALATGGPRTDLVVGPIEGAPVEIGVRLARMVAAHLRDLDIAATAEAVGGRTYVLHAEARSAPISEGAEMLSLRWRLVGPSGVEVGGFDQARPVKGTAWHRGDPALLAFLAGQAAPRVENLISRPSALRAATPLASVFVAPVDGVSGQGRAALTTAMRRALALAEVPVTHEIGEDTYLVLGAVYVTEDAGGRAVEILWTVMAPSGAEAGVVSQRNTLGAGALDEIWAEIAPTVAEGAAGGIVDVLRAVGPLPPPAAEG
jgi:hypothetical protein